MKTTLLLVASLSVMVGCAHTPAPKTVTIPPPAAENLSCSENSCPLPKRTVETKPIEKLPRVQGQMVGVVEDNPYNEEVSDNPYAEMEEHENLLKAMKEAVERDTPCKCQAGDPLCSCL